MVSPGTSVSSTNKTDHHDIAETLLRVALKLIISNLSDHHYIVESGAKANNL